MPNLRIVSDNAIDRAVLTPSSAALPVANLLTDLKSTVWRGVGKTESLRATWTTAEQIGCVALPFCNLSATATMRVRVTNEAQATNLLTYSNQMTVGPWSAGNVILTANPAGVLSPDGTANTTLMVESSGAASTHQLYNTVMTYVAGTAYTFSIFVRQGSGNRTVAIVQYTGSVDAVSTFNLSTGTVISGTGSIQSIGGGWYRCSQTVTATVSGSTTYAAQVFICNSAGTRNYAGDGVTGIYLFGAQVEVGSAASSYYPTTTASATRPLAYIDSWQSYSYNSGNVLCCADPVVKLRGWTAAQSASAYAYGGGSFARVWLPTTSALGLCVDIVDTNNVQGYVEGARMVAGPYWETTYNPSAVTITDVDTTQLTRLESGDQWPDAGKKYRKASIALSKFPAQDRAPLVSLLRNSRAYPILLSAFPQAADTSVERDTLVYGRRSADSDISLQFALTYSSTLEVEGI